MKYFFVNNQSGEWDRLLAEQQPTLEEALAKQNRKSHLLGGIGGHFINFPTNDRNDFITIRIDNEVADDKAGPFVAYAGGNLGLEPVWCATIQEAIEEKRKMVEIIKHGRAVETNLAWVRERLAREEEKRRTA